MELQEVNHAKPSIESASALSFHDVMQSDGHARQFHMNSADAPHNVQVSVTDRGVLIFTNPYGSQSDRVADAAGNAANSNTDRTSSADVARLMGHNDAGKPATDTAPGALLVGHIPAKRASQDAIAPACSRDDQARAERAIQQANTRFNRALEHARTPEQQLQANRDLWNTKLPCGEHIK